MAKRLSTYEPPVAASVPAGLTAGGYQVPVKHKTAVDELVLSRRTNGGEAWTLLASMILPLIVLVAGAWVWQISTDRRVNRDNVMVGGAIVGGSSLYEQMVEGQLTAPSEIRERGELVAKQLVGAKFPEKWNMANAVWSRSTVVDSSLVAVNMSGSNITATRVVNTNMRGVDLHEAAVLRSYLQDSNLMGADMRGVTLNGTTFLRCDLRSVELGGSGVAQLSLRNTSFIDCKVDRETALALWAVPEKYRQGAKLPPVPKD